MTISVKLHEYLIYTGNQSASSAVDEILFAEPQVLATEEDPKVTDLL
jgi:hypothetical protein